MQIPGLTLSADADQVPWRSTRVAGVQWYLLATEGPAQGGTESDGAPAAQETDAGDGPREHQGANAEQGASVLIRMQPGCGYPPHRHLDLEEVLVLSGGYRDAEGVHRAGDYVRYAAGSAHAPIALGETDAPVGPQNPACVLFASARGGIRPLEP